MKHWLTPLLGLLFVFAGMTPAWADVPVPPQPLPEAKTAKLVVVIDQRAEAPRLVVPRSLMGEKKSASLETSTILAGLSLTLAFVSGGVWLARRGRGQAIAAAALTLTAFVCAASSLQADIPKPRPPRPPVVRNIELPANVQLMEKMQIEFVDKGDEIKLLVKKEWVNAEVKPEAKPKGE